MATPEQLDHLDALLTRQEKRIQEAFSRYVWAVKSDRVMAEIILLLEQRRVEEALLIAEAQLASMSVSISDSVTDVGRDAAKELAGLVPTALVGVYFDPSHARAAEMIRRQQMNMIKEITDSQRLAIRTAIARAYDTGQGTAGTARAFRDAVGLTQRQEAAIANYERLLRQSSGEALGRVLRDRRFDSSVRRAARGERQLTESQIERMTASYRARTLQNRAETIARTEGLRATSQARLEATRQMSEQTGIPLSSFIRVWNSTRDKRTRDWHASMQGQRRPMGQDFTDGLGNSLAYPGDPTAPAETVINCRCTETFEIL